MDLFPMLIAGHLIGDWVAQSDWQAANKTTSWRANQLHMASYHLVVAGAVAVSSTPGWYSTLIVAVSWVTHSFIDRRWPVRWLMCHTGSGPFSETTFGVIAVDQALHLSILCVLAAGAPV